MLFFASFLVGTLIYLWTNGQSPPIIATLRNTHRSSHPQVYVPDVPEKKPGICIAPSMKLPTPQTAWKDSGIMNTTTARRTPNWITSVMRTARNPPTTVYINAMAPRIRRAHQMLRYPAAVSPAIPVEAKILPSGILMSAHITTATA